MKINYVLAAMAATTLGANAALTTLSMTPADANLDQTTALNHSGNTVYFYGFNVVPTSTAVDLDGVPEGGGTVGDFHTSAQPSFNTTTGVASVAPVSGDGILRGDFTNSLWREQFKNGNGYTIEAQMTIADGAGNETSFGLLTGSGETAGFDINVSEVGTTWDSSFDLANQGLDNTGQHTWRFVQEAAGGGAFNNWVYRDGVIMNSTAIDGTTTSANFDMWFGDWTGGFDAGYDMEYFSIANGAFAPTPVPEPGSLALIGLGGLALFLRRLK